MKRRAATRQGLTLLLILVMSTYFFTSLQSLKREEARTFQELAERLRAVQERNAEAFEELSKREEAGREAINESVEKLVRETRALNEKIALLEEKRRSELEVLKKEIKSISTDLSSVVSSAVRTAVSVTTDKNKGSGVFVSSNGYVITNNHVVEGAAEATIIDYNGNVYPALIVRTNSERDLALLKIGVEGHDYIKLGDSDKVAVGERVLAIGSPEGLDFTVTEGIVSANKRVFSEIEGSFIQTDVPINQGSSGGPLINSKGELIGINTFKIKGSENLGFAIPSNEVKEFLSGIANE